MASVILRALVTALHEYSVHTVRRPTAIMLSPRTATKAVAEAKAEHRLMREGTVLGLPLERSVDVPHNAVLFLRDGRPTGFMMLHLPVAGVGRVGELTPVGVTVAKVVEQAMRAAAGRRGKSA